MFRMHCQHCGGTLMYDGDDGEGTLCCTECGEYEFLDGHEEPTSNIDDEEYEDDGYIDDLGEWHEGEEPRSEIRLDQITTHEEFVHAMTEALARLFGRKVN